MKEHILYYKSDKIKVLFEIIDSFRRIIKIHSIKYTEGSFITQLELLKFLPKKDIKIINNQLKTLRL